MNIKSLFTTLLVASTAAVFVACDSGSGGSDNRYRDYRRDAERYCKDRHSTSSTAYDDCIDDYLDRYDRYGNDYKHSWISRDMDVSGDKDALENMYFNNGACFKDNLNNSKCGRMNEEFEIMIQTETLKVGTKAIVEIAPIGEDFLGVPLRNVFMEANVKERAGDTLAIDDDGISIIIDDHELNEGPIDIEVRYNSKSIASGTLYYDERDDYYDWRYDDYCDPYYDLYCY